MPPAISRKDGFVNWKRMFPGMAVASVLVMATSFSAPAQVAPAAGPGIPASISSVENTPAIAKEARGWLADLIKINTSNPPGNEQVAAMYIAGILARDGIKADVLDMTPGRSAVVARLQSSAVAQPSKALLLVAHIDTVPVEKARWTRTDICTDAGPSMTKACSRRTWRCSLN